jgi:outer membrane lipoprotein-sorting protein
LISGEDCDFVYPLVKREVWKMKIVFVLVVLFLVVGMVFVSGCTDSVDAPKTQKEAQEAVVDVSSDVQEVEKILEDIDSEFG